MSRHHSVLVPVVMCVLSAYCTTTGTTINVSTFIQKTVTKRPVISTLPDIKDSNTVSLIENGQAAYNSAGNEKKWLNTTFNEDKPTLLVQPDNILVINSSELSADLLTDISVRLNENDILFLPLGCVVSVNKLRTISLLPNCTRNEIIQGCHQYSALITLTFTDQSVLVYRQNVTTFPDDDDGMVTGLSLVDSKADRIEIRWTKPKCDATLPVVNYSISIIPIGAEADKLQVQRIPAEELISSSFIISQALGFSLKSCTEYSVTVRPLYSIQTKDVKAASLVASTKPRHGNKAHNFTTVWEGDLLTLSWIGVDCSRNLSGWRLNISHEPEHNDCVTTVTIPKHCSQLGDDSQSHQIRMLYHNDGIICYDETLLAINYQLKTCVVYHFRLIPLWSDNLDRRDLPVSVDVQPLVKVPGRPGNIKFYEKGDILVVEWKPPIESPRCVKFYRYSLIYDSETSEGLETNETSIRLPLKPCTKYTISVWSVGRNGSRSSTAAHAQGYTSAKNIDLPKADTSVQSINQTCLLVGWSVPTHTLLHHKCVGSFQIHIQPPTENGITHWHTADEKAREHIICHLLPATEYQVHVQVISLDGNTSESSGTVYQSTLSDYDAATTGLIVVISLLVVAMISVGLFVTRPWLNSSCRKNVWSSKGMRLGRLSNRSFRMMGRKRSHPIKVADLPQVTRRLCSSASHQMEMEFEDLNIIADARQPPLSVVALRPENKNKNRYVNILPFDHSRVMLSTLPDDPYSDYINASYILGFNGPKEFIASQGPKDCTIGDFWRMIWEQDVRLIVMVTSLEEQGKAKCHRYWPDYDEETLTFGNLTIRQLDQTDFDSYSTRSFQVKNDSCCRTVKHMYLKGWPDFGCPDNPELLIHFIEVVRQTITQLNQPQSPILVHCSAGVGRTGTLIAVDWLMQECRASKVIDVFSTVLRLRDCRMRMVQSEDQYEFVYKCLTHFVNTRLFPPKKEVVNDNPSDTSADLLINGDHPFIDDDQSDNRI